MKGRPDVIKELNFDHRLNSARRQSDRASHDVRFSEWRVVNAVTAKLSLQVRRNFEDPPFALYLIERLFTRAIGDVLAKNYNTRIALHLCVQAAIDQIDHGAGFVA